MSLTNSNLYTESYKKIKEFLLTINGIDPRNRYKGNIVHASMPNINQKGFDGYPFIVLKIDVSEENKSFDSEISNKIFRIILGVYSDDPSQVDTISDSIVNNLKDMTKLTDFQVKELSSSPMAWNMDEHGKKISFRNIGIIARSRI